MANKQIHPFHCNECGEFSELGELSCNDEFICIVCLIKKDDGYIIDMEYGARG